MTLANKGYWKRYAETIHDVSILLVYTIPDQELVLLHNGLKALTSQEVGDECSMEISQGWDFSLSIFCKAPPLLGFPTSVAGA